MADMLVYARRLPIMTTAEALLLLSGEIRHKCPLRHQRGRFSETLLVNVIKGSMSLPKDWIESRRRTVLVLYSFKDKTSTTEYLLQNSRHYGSKS